MQTNQPLPPGLKDTGPVVLFDGVCRLCSFWARFLIRFDRKRVFKLATVQSAEGKALLKWFGLPTDTYETMAVIEGREIYTKSAAFIRVVRNLPFPWPLAATVWLIPRPIRDWMYDRIALNRYTLFGQYDACLLPAPDHNDRFLGAKSD